MIRKENLTCKRAASPRIGPLLFHHSLPTNRGTAVLLGARTSLAGRPHGRRTAGRGAHDQEITARGSVLRRKIGDPMPRFEEVGGADDAALAHPLSEARARALAATRFRSAAIPDRRASATGDVLVVDRPAPGEIPTSSGTASATSPDAAAASRRTPAPGRHGPGLARRRAARRGSAHGRCSGVPLPSRCVAGRSRSSPVAPPGSARRSAACSAPTGPASRSPAANRRRSTRRRPSSPPRASTSYFDSCDVRDAAAVQQVVDGIVEHYGGSTSW